MKDLIEELRSGCEYVAPDEMPLELARLCALCEKAASELENLQALNKGLADSLQWVNDDPYKVLSKINVNEHTEKKNGLTYLSWAWAWDTLLSYYPDSFTTINRTASGFPYWTDGQTCWVDVGVTVAWNGKERTRSEVFPVMDYKNRSIPADKVTSFDINTALQRAWTKAIARHGLGFYIYAGQDLPNDEAEAQKAKESKLISAEQAEQVKALYSPEEIETMLKRLKKGTLMDVTVAQAEKMIAKRDHSLIQDETPTF